MEGIEFLYRENKIYNDAIATWGREAQMMKAAEELSEMAAAINRLMCCEVSGYRNHDEVLEELMLCQLRMLIDMPYEIYVEKLNALEEKIRKAREAHAEQ